jgi:hypothetical protein
MCRPAAIKMANYLLFRINQVFLLRTTSRHLCARDVVYIGPSSSTRLEFMPDSTSAVVLVVGTDQCTGRSEDVTARLVD